MTPQLLGTADQIEALEEQRLHIGYIWEPPAHPFLAREIVDYDLSDETMATVPQM